MTACEVVDAKGAAAVCSGAVRDEVKSKSPVSEATMTMITDGDGGGRAREMRNREVASG